MSRPAARGTLFDVRYVIGSNRSANLSVETVFELRGASHLLGPAYPGAERHGDGYSSAWADREPAHRHGVTGSRQTSVKSWGPCGEVRSKSERQPSLQGIRQPVIGVNAAGRPRPLFQGLPVRPVRVGASAETGKSQWGSDFGAALAGAGEAPRHFGQRSACAVGLGE